MDAVGERPVMKAAKFPVASFTSFRRMTLFAMSSETAWTLSVPTPWNEKAALRNGSGFTPSEGDTNWVTLSVGSMYLPVNSKETSTMPPFVASIVNVPRAPAILKLLTAVTPSLSRISIVNESWPDEAGS